MHSPTPPRAQQRKLVFVRQHWLLSWHLSPFGDLYQNGKHLLPKIFWGLQGEQKFVVTRDHLFDRHGMKGQRKE